MLWLKGRLPLVGMGRKKKKKKQSAKREAATNRENLVTVD